MIKRRKNYDSPFEREEFENLERETILDNEFPQDTDFSDEYYDYVPHKIMPSFPTSIWQSAFTFNNNSHLNDYVDYKTYKDMEGLK